MEFILSIVGDFLDMVLPSLPLSKKSRGKKWNNPIGEKEFFEKSEGNLKFSLAFFTPS